MKIFFSWFVTLLLIFGVADSASAMNIDFRDSAWSSADKQQSFTVDGVTATAFNGDALLYQDGKDGIGIYGREDDEIDSEEILQINFTASKNLTGFMVTDLFAHPDGTGVLVGEQGQAHFYGSSGFLLGSAFFSGTDSKQNGERE